MRRILIALALFASACTGSPDTAREAVAPPADAVVISEFLASNDTGLTDTTGDHSDWIELRNTTGAPVDLTGWRLSDDSTIHTFASGTRIDGEYLVLFASGDTERSGPTEIHLPFKLGADGDRLVLETPAGAASTPAWFDTYEPQTTDVSYGIDSTGSLASFANPSPGSANGVGLVGVVGEVELTVAPGWHSDAFAVVLQTPNPSGSSIWYTTDGATPALGVGTEVAPGSTLNIAQTTILRAVAVRADGTTGPVKTASYLFAADIVQQNNGAPPGWPPSRTVNRHRMDYGMDPEVTVDATEAVASSLQAIPSISLVTDVGHLFDPGTGIYVNPRERGREWERPVSVEIFGGWSDEASEAGPTQIDAGLRIRGGYSRTEDNPKHSFRLLFRNDYGGPLQAAMFGDEGPDRFERLDLRTAQNYGWSWVHNRNTTFIREVLSRDAQGAMGQPYTRSRFVHLFLNGQYWGLYMTQERVTDEFGETHFGGDEDDYDVIKPDSSNDAVAEASDGELDDWLGLWDTVSDLRVDDLEFATLAQEVDLTSLADFYLLHFYSGDIDSAPSWFARNPETEPPWQKSNNWYAIRRRNGDENERKWRFIDHDSEHSLCGGLGLRGANDSLTTVDNTPPWNLLTGTGSTQEYLSPAWLHEALTTNERYRALFRSRVTLHLLEPGGALTIGPLQERLEARVTEVSGAILAESARWGDGGREPAFGPAEWTIAVDRLRSCVDARLDVVEGQLRADGLWPE